MDTFRTNMGDFKRALELARSRNVSDELKSLLEARSPLGETPLHYFAIERDLQLVKFLIEMGAQINSQDDFGMTVLGSAALIGENGTIVDILLSSGADPLIKNSVGDTILDNLRVLNRHEEAELIEKWTKN